MKVGGVCIELPL